MIRHLKDIAGVIDCIHVSSENGTLTTIVTKDHNLSPGDYAKHLIAAAEWFLDLEYQIRSERLGFRDPQRGENV